MNNTESPRWPVAYKVKGRTFVAGNSEEKKLIEQMLNRGENVFEALAGLGLVEPGEKK